MQSPKYNYEGNCKYPYEYKNYALNWILRYSTNLDYIERNMYRLTPLQLSSLSYNPNAIPFFEKHPEHINWDDLQYNVNAIQLIRKKIQSKKYLKRIRWDVILLSGLFIRQLKQKDIIPILEEHFNKIDWETLSIYSTAELIPFLEKHLNRLNWVRLSRNPDMIPLLERFPERISWYELSRNSNAIPILIKNLEKVNMYEFSRHPKAIPFLEENLDKINWCGLSGNPDAIPLLLKYPENIVWGRQLYTYAY